VTIPSVCWQCDECRLKAKRKHKERERRRRKALKRAAVSEPYTLAGIAERDGYRCGLCRRKVTMGLPPNHPRAPTIDHIVPLSISRDDTRTNVQLAHRDCNMAKCARDGGQQLLLIG
jgi:5-methylcytosine-specific restriction endonuclease McrA